jgi:hypothetical protein
LGVVEACVDFGFSGRSEDVAQDAAEDMDGAVQFGRWGIFGCCRQGAEEENATRTGMGLGFGEIGGITVHMEAHVTGVVANGGVRMGTGVVEEVNGHFSGGKGAFGLASKGNEDGVVDCLTVVKEDTNDLLKSGNPSGVKWFSGVDWSNKLDFLTLGWFGPFGQGVRWLG